jgi:hypothetical protein
LPDCLGFTNSNFSCFYIETNPVEAVWHLAHDNGVTQVHQLTKATGIWIGPKRKVLFECSLTSNYFDVFCYIGSQPGVDKDTWALAVDHIEATASNNKPTNLIIDFEDGCLVNHSWRLEERGYDVDSYDYCDEWSRFVMIKHLA